TGVELRRAPTVASPRAAGCRTWRTWAQPASAAGTVETSRYLDDDLRQPRARVLPAEVGRPLERHVRLAGGSRDQLRQHRGAARRDRVRVAEGAHERLLEARQHLPRGAVR